jgi:hypothetical protein
MNQFSQLSTFPVFDQLPEARIMADGFEIGIFFHVAKI